jgi:hypothetical protein
MAEKVKNYTRNQTKLAYRGFPSSLAIIVLSPVGQLVLRRRDRYAPVINMGIYSLTCRFSNCQKSGLIYNRGSQLFIRKVKPPVH